MSKVNQPVDCAQWKVMECDGRKVAREMWRDCTHSQMIREQVCVMRCARNWIGENEFWTVRGKGKMCRDCTVK